MVFIRPKDSSYIQFQQIFENYKTKIYSTSYSIVKSHYTAEEITQEIFIKLWLNRNLLTEIDNMEGYIYRITRNYSLNYLRKVASDSKLVNHLIKVTVKSENRTDSNLNESEYKRLIRQALEGLSPQRRLVYKLSREDGLNYAEIADQMSLSKNTVKNHLFAALTYIRSFLTNNGVNPTIVTAICFHLL